MKIILLKDVKKIGRRYEIKEVADGYAMNSLIPANVAVPATPSYIKFVDEKKKQDSMLKEEFKKMFEFGISKLTDGKLHIKGKMNERGHLFAGISKDKIIDEFKKETGVVLSDEHFELEKPLKEVGEHKIDISIDGAKYKLVVFVKAEK